ncbi:MAG: hypothetical protein V7606_3160 [Burkholderiales bacterium]
MTHASIVPDDGPVAQMQPAADQGPGDFTECAIVLKPLTHPELGDIRIEESLFAIGRSEPPFETYAPAVTTDLSRRHARIFFESGAVYLADLGSKNGTSVNGVEVRQKTARLNDGDEVCFGKALCYRVQLGARVRTPGRGAKLVSLTLTPERSDLGLQPVVVTQFPFLISKADEVFSRYKEEFPHQVNYLSRRHAHIFLKGGAPFIEDLGSTNGTFVAGKRLDEHAAPLEEDGVIGFGGHHFVYKVSLQTEEVEADPTLTKLSPSARSVAVSDGDADKTTFVAAAGSFLDIFCVDQAPQQDDVEINEELKQADDAPKGPNGAGKRRPRSKLAVFMSELSEAFSDKDRKSPKRVAWGVTLLVATVAIAAFFNYRAGAPERELKDLLARGEHGQAAAVARLYAQSNPDNAEIKVLATEAILKAHLPEWLRLLKAREFDRAAAVLTRMKQAGAEASLVSELEWIGNIEQFVLGRGGVDAPIRIYADEVTIKNLLDRWNEDTNGHQRALDRISSIVPEFREPYAEALSHLRKLQSDDAVYLAAIDRLKTSIDTELKQDRPEALEAVLKEYAEKYPRLGLESVRQDLLQYVQVENEARARNLGPLVALIAKAKFATPPFQAKFRTLAASNRLPPADVIQEYQAVSADWREGHSRQAFERLQKMNKGSWADAAARELERKKALVDQYAELQKARVIKEYDERLLSFYGSLHPDEDIYFIRAVSEEVGQNKDKALARAQALMKQALAQWRQYRENGAIEGRQRLEGTISDQFRTQSRLLSESSRDAQQGMRIVTQLKADVPAEWTKARDEINAETELQRKSMRELRNVLEPSLLKAKLALLGDSDEERKSKTAN